MSRATVPAIPTAESHVRAYEAAVGSPVTDLVTPALLLHRPALVRNLEKMAKHVQPPTQLRPHAKTHKSPNVAAMQVACGAIGITTATVWEASALARGGIEDILIANQVVGPTKVAHLVEAATAAQITVAVDDLANVEELSAAFAHRPSGIGVLIEVDIGMGRCGVRAPAEAVGLAGKITKLPGIQLCGVMGFEGHCSLERDRSKRSSLAQEAVETLLKTADRLEATGFPIETVSAGGTGTFDLTGSNPRVTELQAGSYAFMDTAHSAAVSEFEFALTVLATVISRHGSTIVLDAGKKTLGLDNPAPTIPGLSAAVRYVAEEHTVVDVDAPPPPSVGERVEIVPSYCPVTVNLHGGYFVTESDFVVDAWPILARGPGWA
jgi:D-serine deaminase-like pyridoxal phosphate-dependent protein